MSTNPTINFGPSMLTLSLLFIRLSDFIYNATLLIQLMNILVRFLYSELSPQYYSNPISFIPYSVFNYVIINNNAIWSLYYINIIMVTFYLLVLSLIILIFILNNIILLLNFLFIILLLLLLLLINNIIPITLLFVLIYSSLLSIIFIMNGLLIQF